MNAPAVRRTRPAFEPERVLRPRRPFEVIEDVVGADGKRVRFAVVAGVVAIVLSAFVIVSMHVRMAQNQVELSRVQDKIATEQALNAQRRADVAHAAAPSAIVAAAQRLGLVEAGPARVLRVTAPDATSSADRFNGGVDAANNAGGVGAAQP